MVHRRLFQAEAGILHFFHQFDADDAAVGRPALTLSKTARRMRRKSQSTSRQAQAEGES